MSGDDIEARVKAALIERGIAEPILGGFVADGDPRETVQLTGGIRPRGIGGVTDPMMRERLHIRLDEKRREVRDEIEASDRARHAQRQRDAKRVNVAAVVREIALTRRAERTRPFRDKRAAAELIESDVNRRLEELGARPVVLRTIRRHVPEAALK